MKRSVSLFTAACAAVLLAGAPSARAEDLPWRFDWTPSGGPDLKLGQNILKLASSGDANSYLQLTNEPQNKPFGSAAGASDLTMTGLKVFSDAPRSNPDSLDGSNPDKFSLRITDVTTGLFHDFAYTVKFGGLISSQSAKVTAMISPMAPFNNVPIGAGLYSVSSPTYTPPGPPDSSNPAAISVAVDVTPASGGKPPPGIQGAPEPSTMVLSCVGLSFLGVAGWRKRRQVVVEVA
jgi:hypothetical protein